MERPHHENAKLEAELAALAARHEKALVEGAARLAERDEARAQIAVLTKAQVEAVDMASEAHRQAVEARAQIAAKDAEITRLRAIVQSHTGRVPAAPARETE